MLENEIHLLKLQRKVNSFEILEKPFWKVNEDELSQECAWADEIYINKDFPSASFHWGFFPRTQTRYLKNILKRDAKNRFDMYGNIRVAHKNIDQVTHEGVSKLHLAYIAVQENEVVSLEDKLDKYKYKIKHINSLPDSLCSAIAKSNESDDFMVVWVQEDFTIISINSHEGIVKIARKIPLGFSQYRLSTYTEYCQQFSNEINADIEKTLVFYSQNFRTSNCKSFYILGNSTLEEVLEKYPISVIEGDIKFHPHGYPIPGMDLDTTNSTLHLTGNLFCHKNLNLVDNNIILSQKVDLSLRMVLAITIIILLFFGLRLFQINPVDESKLNTFKKNNQKIEQLKKEKFEIKKRIQEIDQVKGWESFYKNTFKNQPAWNDIFSAIAQNIPPEMVIDQLEIRPREARTILKWICVIKGHSLAENWDGGLKSLRDFGARLHSSPYAKLNKVQYTPKKSYTNVRATSSSNYYRDKQVGSSKYVSFDFKFEFDLTPVDKKQ